MQPTNEAKTLLALDIGGTRIGVALANTASLSPAPLMTLTNDSSFLTNLKKVVEDNEVKLLIIGLPRGLNGQDTEQTDIVRRLASQIKDDLNMDVVFQDEALTSVKAREELDERGKIYSKSDIDKLAACYILEDYISEQR